LLVAEESKPSLILEAWKKFQVEHANNWMLTAIVWGQQPDLTTPICHWRPRHTPVMQIKLDMIRTRYFWLLETDLKLLLFQKRLCEPVSYLYDYFTPQNNRLGIVHKPFEMWRVLNIWWQQQPMKITFILKSVTD
jgi:hypothetical protein